MHAGEHRGETFLVISMLVLALVVAGCAALPVAAVGGAVLEAGGGALVKTGTEYTASGAALRTFTIPVADVHTAVLEALRRAEITVVEDETSSKGQRIAAQAEHRKVRISLVPLTRSLTSMELVVKRNFLASDKATASELLARTEQVLAESPRFAPRLDRGPTAATHP